MTTATKLRLRFAKCGDLRLVSHHDIMRCLERMVRRAQIPLSMSQGFNPRPKIVFALALGLGIEGRDEVVDIELSEPREPDDVFRRLAEAAPPGSIGSVSKPCPRPHRPRGRSLSNTGSPSPSLAARRPTRHWPGSWPARAAW